MLLLAMGVLLWSVMHFLPALDVGFRRNLIAKIGENAYKGLFAVMMIVSIVLMVRGWKSTLPQAVYLPPDWGRHATALFMLLGLILFVASTLPNNIRRVIRHPQLTGVIFWSVGHLISNGDSRSLVLFGGIGIWAVIEILLINRRDPQWIKPQPVPFAKNAVLVGVAVVAYLVLMFVHEWLFGVSPMGPPVS